MEQNNPTSADCSAARSKRRKFGHISPVLSEMHWLPVKHRISYKILLLTRHWLAMLHNISQHWCQNMYHHGPSIHRINISSIYQDGGLKHMEIKLSLRQPRPFGTLYPQGSNLKNDFRNTGKLSALFCQLCIYFMSCIAHHRTCPIYLPNE